MERLVSYGGEKGLPVWSNGDPDYIGNIVNGSGSLKNCIKEGVGIENQRGRNRFDSFRWCSGIGSGRTIFIGS